MAPEYYVNAATTATRNYVNYGRNPFVQKNDINNGNVYRFKFRGKEVCITLYHDVHYMQDILYMHVDGNGKTEWCDAATTILNKQCERHQREHSRKSQIPDIPETAGESKKELVSEEDFLKCFVNPNAYGKYSPKPWPTSTILLYKYSSNATTKYLHIPENTWIRVDNDPGETHAEVIMIEDLKNIKDYLKIQPDDDEGSYKTILSIEVIQNYSPCYKCAPALRHLKKTLDEKVKQSKTRNLSQTTEVEDDEKVKFKITFSNFYKHIEERYGKEGIDNREGLKDLLRSDIKLDTFSDDNWHYFFNATGLVTKRQKRERDDKKILQYLEGLVTSERILAIEQDLRENDLL